MPPDKPVPGVPQRHQRISEVGPEPRRAPVIPSDQPPPRRQLPSEGGIHPEVFAEIRSLDSKVDQLALNVATIRSDSDLKHAATKASIESILASNRHETLKVLGGVMIAAITAVGGSKALAPAAAPPQQVFVRSAYDRALEECQKLQGDDARGKCIGRVAADAASRPR